MSKVEPLQDVIKPPPDIAPPKERPAPEPKAIQVGDTVWYVPHISHAFNCNQNNEYPWAIGMKKNPHYEENPDTGEQELVEDIVEVKEGDLHRNVLPHVFRHPNPKEERKKLIPLRPKNPWRATITALNPDGTANIDIDSNIGAGMVTLHYRNVPHDPQAQTPHSWHKGVI